MGEYNMTEPANGTPVAGMCHARGINTGLPPQWLMYVTVSDIDESARRCTTLGGRLITPVTQMGLTGRYCVIQDPSAAVAALVQPAPSSVEEESPVQ
ncbi:MAG: hypothetical protein OEV30_00885 [Ignavibacteria bacterium]|nr:hypothetical protein [Ignavibacteria bacterium]